MLTPLPQLPPWPAFHADQQNHVSPIPAFVQSLREDLVAGRITMHDAHLAAYWAVRETYARAELASKEYDRLYPQGQP